MCQKTFSKGSKTTWPQGIDIYVYTGYVHTGCPIYQVNNCSASTNLCCFHIRFLLFAFSCVLVLGPFQISAVWCWVPIRVPIPGIGSFLVWMQWKKWFFWGGLLFFLEIPRNVYLLIHIERNGSYTNLRFAKTEKRSKSKCWFWTGQK